MFSTLSVALPSHAILEFRDQAVRGCQVRVEVRVEVSVEVRVEVRVEGRVNVRVKVRTDIMIYLYNYFRK